MLSSFAMEFDNKENVPVTSPIPDVTQPTVISWEEVFLKGWRPYAWLCAVGFVLYFQILFFDFTYFDDHTLIINNQYFIGQLSNIIQSFKEDVFRRPYGEAYYRPILTISFILDAQLGVLSPVMYHLSNIIMHLIASCLVFRFLLKLKYRKDLSLFFSLLFTVHPVLAQGIAWIPGRNDPLVTIFVILSFIYFLDFVEKRSLSYYGLHMLFFALALFTKEIILLFPVMLIFYLHMMTKEKILSFKEKVLVLGWLVIIMVWFFLRWTALKSPREIPFPNMITASWESLPAVIIFFGKIFFPFRLSVISTLQDSTLIYGFITIALVTIALIKSKGIRFTVIIFGLVWFLIFLVPTFITSHLSGTPYFIEHRIYVPLIGFILIMLETDIIKNLNFLKRNTLIICATIIGFLFILTFLHSADFKNRVKFWENAARTSPSVMIGHGTLAPIYYVEKEYDKAEIEYKKILELDPKHKDAHYWLGFIYLGKNRPQEAEEEFKRQIAVNPESKEAADAIFELGGIYYNKGRIKEAEEAWKQALEINPETPLAHNNLGFLYMNKKMLREAEIEFRKELAVNSKSDRAMFNLGLLYRNYGDSKKAVELWKQAIQANPDNIQAYEHLAMYYVSQKDFEQAKYCIYQLQKRGVRIPPEILKNLELR